jgi:hypothetical protein
MHYKIGILREYTMYPWHARRARPTSWPRPRQVVMISVVEKTYGSHYRTSVIFIFLQLLFKTDQEKLLDSTRLRWNYVRPGDMCGYGA